MTTIGRVDFTVDFDGKTLPQQAKAIGQRMGQQLSRSMQAEFDRSMGKFARDLDTKMNVTGKKAGREFSNALSGVLKSRRAQIANSLAQMLGDRTVFESFVKNAGSVQEGLDKISASLDKARDKGIVNQKQFDSMAFTFQNWGGSLLEAERNLKAHELELEKNRKGAFGLVGAFSRLKKEIDATNNSSSSFFKRWKEMPHGFRQFVFYAVLFTAIAPEIAVLGSAAGGGLTIFAAAAFAGAVALGVFIAGVIGLGDELSSLPAAIQPAAAAFQSFTASMTSLREQIQLAMAGGLEAGFTNLKATVDALVPTFQLLGAAVGAAFASFTASIAPGTEGFARLQAVLAAVAPLIGPLVVVAQNLGAALGNIFLVAAPFALNFLNTLGALTAQFAAWAQSAEGIQSLTGWFEQTEVLFASLANLAGSLGTTLATLVTPELVASFAGFVDQLAAFLPFVGMLLDVVAQLGLFEILGSIFEALGPVIATLAPVLGQFAQLLGGAIVSAIQTLAPALLQLAGAIVPIIQGLMPLLTPLLGAIGQIIAALLPALRPLLDAFVVLLEPITQIVTILLDALMPIIIPLVELLGELLGVAIEPLTYAFQALAFILNLLAPVLTILGQVVGAVVQTIVALFTGDLSSIGQIWVDLWNGLPGPLQDFITNTIGMFADFFANTIGMFSDFFSNTFGMFEDFFTNTIGMFEDFWTNTVGMFEDFGGHVQHAWEAMWQGMSDFVADVWNGIIGFIEGGINGVIDLINGMIKGINTVAGAIGLGKIGLIGKVNFSGLRLAAGGLVDTPTRALIGENGPEAVVPLNRPVGAVDPSVRVLSAILQGKPLPGSEGGDGPRAIVEAGAVQIIGVRDPDQAADAVIDRIVARIGG